MRKAIGKKLRFDVFKRDGFVCQYCGSHPPEVILHVDHIKPVCDGGTNEIDNLITSCESCNLGKGANPLSNIPESLKEKTAKIAEAEEQIKGYKKILSARRDRIESELWKIVAVVNPDSPDSVDRDWANSIKKFLERLGLHECLEAADLARAKYKYGGKRTFLYFCGICWNKIRASAENF